MAPLLSRLTTTSRSQLQREEEIKHNIFVQSCRMELEETRPALDPTLVPSLTKDQRSLHRRPSSSIRLVNKLRRRPSHPSARHRSSLQFIPPPSAPSLDARHSLAYAASRRASYPLFARPSDPIFEMATTTANDLTFRAPPHITAGDLAPFNPPTNAWLSGNWFVTHSSLPMWKEKQNVQITYTELPNGKIDDLVRSQSLGADPDSKFNEIKGVDSPDKSRVAAWKWRGKGLLMIASSQWELLGSGTITGDDGKERQWAVTYFAKTIYTPPGIDVYAREKEGLGESALEKIKDGLRVVGRGDAEFIKLVDSLFEVKRA